MRKLLSRRFSGANPVIKLGFVATLVLLASTAHGANILYSRTSTGGAWLTSTDWTGSVLPTGNDTAQFGSNPNVNATVGINGNGTLVPGSQIEDLGAIEITSTRGALTLSMGNSSTTANKDFTLNLKGVTVNGVANTILRHNATGTFTIQNTQGSGTLTMPVSLGNATANVVNVDSSGNIVISSSITGIGRSLTLNNATSGDLRLSGSNSFNGGITIAGGTSGGRLRIDAVNSLPTTGTIAINTGGRMTLNIAGTFGGVSQALTFNPNQTTNPSLDILSGAAVNWQGTVAINADTRIEANGAGGSLTLSGNATGSGTLFKQASGNLILSGTANALTGGTNIGNGTVTVNSGSSMGTGALTLFQTSTNNAALTLNNAAQSVGSLSSQFTAVTGTQTHVITLIGTALTVNQTVDGTYGTGAVSTLTSTITGTGSLIKLGAATLTLSGANTYNGTTAANAGTLILGAGGSITSNVTIANAVVNGAALRGVGTVNGTVTAGGGVNFGRIWPGTSSSFGLASNETLAVSGAVDLSVGGKLSAILSSTGASGPRVQSLNVTGTNATVTLGGTSALTLGVESGTNYVGDYIILQTSNNAAGISKGFATTTTLNAGVTLVYLKSDATTQLFPTGTDFTLQDPNSSNANTPAQFVVLRTTNNVTPVKVADFAAKSEGAGVTVSWTSVSEYQNAGFNIYRRALESADWVKVNPALIAGRITNPDENKYAYLDWVSAGMYEYKLESVDLFGAHETYHTLTGVVHVDEFQTADVTAEGIDAATRSIDMAISAQTAQRVETQFAALRTTTIAQAQTGTQPIQTGVARDISVSSHAASVAVSKPRMTTTMIGARWFSSGSVGTASSYSTAKVVYKNSGVMLIPQASMPAGFDLNQVALQREGRSIKALANVADGLLVYAPGYSDNYTDKDALFLRKTAATTVSGLAASASGLFSSSLPLTMSSAVNVTNDYHDIYFDYGQRPYTFEPWFSRKYLTQGSTQDFSINLADVTRGQANLVVNVWSLTSSNTVNPDHGVQVLVNGQAVGETAWDGGGKMMQFAFSIPSGALQTGDNVVRLVTPMIAGLDTQIALLHSISVSYTRGLNGAKPIEINTPANTASLFEIYNVPSTGAWVVDARFSDRASLVPTEFQMQADNTLKLRFMAQSGGSGTYLVVPVGQENSPLTISARQVKPLALNGTYLATGPAQFASGIQPVLIKRSKEGIRGAFVDQEQLFDYYNYGRYGPDGIRNAVRSARPTYLLLVGRTTYDYRNYEGQNIDPLCPAFLVSTTFWAQTTSDSAFGDLGRGYPEVAVGRLPVNNTTELSGAVNHIVSYKGIPQSGIRLHAVADRNDPLVADFGTQLDSMMKANNPDLTWQENYLAKTYATAPEVTAAMKAAANGGADLIMYSGHGNAARLGAYYPRILDQTTVQEWTGNTVFIQATCTANWMAKNVPGYKSIAIQALTQPQGGISASIGTSTYMNSDAAVSFMQTLLSNSSTVGTRWGNALMKTQQWAAKLESNNANWYMDLSRTEQLFGDPAMPVYAKERVISKQPAAGQF